MTIWEISEKADYIAQRHRRLQDQWHLLQLAGSGITPLESAPASRNRAARRKRSLLLSRLSTFVFTSRWRMVLTATPIEYYVETKDASISTDCTGAARYRRQADERVNNRDREQVLEHHLEKSSALTTASIPL